MIKNISLLLETISFRQAMNNLSYTIQTGQNAFKHANGLNLFEHLQRNSDEAEVFNNAMTAMTLSQVSTISSTL